MVRKKEVPQEVVTEEKIPPESDTPDVILESWPQLQRLTNGTPVEELFEKGWTPYIKTVADGRQYITLRIHGKDPETGKIMDTERGLGAFDPENPIRWETLIGLFPQKELLPAKILKTPDSPIPNASSNRDRSAITTAKIARVNPIPPSVNLELETLYWYMWAQKKAAYPGTLDNFINVSVSTLFREHFKLELAVIDLKEENF